MSRSLLPPALFLALFGAGCLESWKGTDTDGDGVSVADGDCWDSAEGPPGSGLSGDQIGPGMPDTPYDGIDADCSGNDDYDLDGDGYVTDPDHVGLATLGVPGSGEAHIAAGDCWDDPALAPDDTEAHGGFNFTNVLGEQLGPEAVHPDQDDVWYDGPDQDCGGNSDFDQDGDGQDANTMTRQDGSLGDDCLDGAPDEDPRINAGGLSPADVYLGATETWYDGTDQDCDGVVVLESIEGVEFLADCDFDRDGAPVDNELVPDGSPCLDYTELARDCNDQDDRAVPDPSVPEVYYNGTDDNCSATLPGGIPDGDGDADGDGHWSVDYDTLVPDPDETVEPGPKDDCWDADPDAADFEVPSDYVGVDVVTFNASGNPDDPITSGDVTTFADIVWAAGSLGPADVNPDVFDRPYDLVDQDCGGEDVSEELDWDGDGVDSMYQWHDPGTGLTGGDDCMDCSDDCASAEPGSELDAICAVVCDNDAYYDVSGVGSAVVNPGGLVSTDVYSGAGEIYGDGTDQNCDRNIDYDADLDFSTTDPTAALAQGEARSGYYNWDSVGGLYSTEVDCNDDDTLVNPEVLSDPWYDGVDSDCGGENDYDADQDGYVPDEYEGLATYQDTAKRSAYELSGTDAAPADDCVDSDATYNPGVTEVWYDSFDKDCADDDDYDADADGYASEIQAASYQVTTHAGAPVAGTGGLTTDDCHDQVFSTNPGATEDWYDGVDKDCDEGDDWDQDLDGHADDDYSATYGPTTNEAGNIAGTGTYSTDDCNDDDDAVYTGAADSWYDGVDNDCDERDDYDADEDAYATDAVAYGATYQDTAKRGAYELTATGSLPDTDCNDEESVINPGEADSWYDGIDHDCDERDDYDADEDGYVEDDNVGLITTQSAVSDSAYELPATGSLPGNDCVDSDASYNPGETEVWYDSFDKDCADDDDFDADADGHADDGSISSATYVVTTHAGTTVAGTGSLPTDDCNDTESAINPDEADDWYDGIDHDCDERDDFDADEDAYAADDEPYASTYQSEVSSSSTFLVSGTGSLPTTDCNDVDADINEGITETWYDGVDADCGDDDDFDADADGYVQDADVGKITYYVEGSTSSADRVPGTGSLPGDDCVDSDATYNPGETEVWYDGFDKDCADDDDFDADADGHADDGSVSSATYTTTTHAGAAVGGTGSLPTDDCNDGDDTVYTGAFDSWYDGIDSDCGEDDDFDADGDGDASDAVTYTSTTDGISVVPGSGTLPSDDCNDTDSAVASILSDTWYDGVDTDCGGEDDYDADADLYVQTIHVGDATYQSSAGASAYLVAGTGSLPGDDCVDSDATYNPGQTEVWYDGFDKDCADDDDYDADDDGYANEVYTATYAATTHAGTPVAGTGSLSVSDCNDTEDNVSPGSLDTWYDGVDSDCGEDDDFDRDGDGYASEEEAASYAITYQSYSSTASTWVVSGTGGFTADDCNDASVSIRPGATDDWYDGIDSDCGDDDDYDADGDGYVLDVYDGETTSSGSGTDSFGGTLPAGDCEDDELTGAAYAPDNAETWYDGLDHDCGSDDDYDADADGFVDIAYAGLDTSVGTVVVATAGDPTECNDTDADINPDAIDTWYDGVDSDCGEDDDYDADLDGYVDDADVGEATYQHATLTTVAWLVAGTGALPGGDCLESEGSDGDLYYPGATDAWDDGLDYDCAEDDDYDADGDGYVTDANVGEQTFHGTTPVAGTGSLPGGDCNSTDATFAPGNADAWYDGLDTDCDERDDYDADEDGYASSSHTYDFTYTSSTSTAFAFRVAGTGLYDDSDCDDANALINVDAIEVCDGGTNVDEDCNEVANDDDPGVDPATQSIFWLDGDSDSYGDPLNTGLFCDQPGGYVTNDLDCDDDNAAINPAAQEVCDPDDVDEDCDDFIDDADSSVDAGTYSTFYTDSDGDTYGDPLSTVQACDLSAGVVANSDDCNDSAALAYTGATEVCDGVDNDCDGDTDDADSGVVYDSATDSWFTDFDGDGYGDELEAEGLYLACADPSGEAGFPTVAVQDNTDCDDSESTVFLGNTELLDGLDNDCDDDWDEGGLITADSEYVLLTEVHINPSVVADADHEWFEIHNPNTFDVTLDENWAFFDNAGGFMIGDHTGAGQPTAITIAAGGYAVFAYESDPLLNGNVSADYEYGGDILFANSGDELDIVFSDPEGSDVSVDMVDFGGNWESAGSALQLDNDAVDGYPRDGDLVDNTAQAAWCDATTPWDSGDNGSPGTDNEACP